MHSTISPTSAPNLPVSGLDLDRARAVELVSHARATATTKAYAADWRTFETWCSSRGHGALPALPETVFAFVAHLDGLGRKPSTIGRALVAIAQEHKRRGLETPTAHGSVRDAVKGVRRTRGVAPAQVSPVAVEELRAMLATRSEMSLLGLRDRALLALGFAGAFRRSELVALEVGDLAFVPKGLVVTVRRSKTDQEGEGRKVGIPFGTHTCAVRALRAWVEGAGIIEGKVFRSVTRHGKLGEGLSAQVVASVVKDAAKGAGLDPARYAGHSLRAGLATAAARAGKTTRAIMGQTGHRSEAMVARYVREVGLFDDNAASGIGL